MVAEEVAALPMVLETDFQVDQVAEALRAGPVEFLALVELAQLPRDTLAATDQVQPVLLLRQVVAAAPLVLAH
jgi:hypothetical protein